MYTISAEIRVLRLRSDKMWRNGRETGGRKRENDREIGGMGMMWGY